MVRLVEEDIEVRVAQTAQQQCAGEGGQRPDAPEQFLWRGRLYRVTEVVDHWQERRDWWREAAARPLDEVSLARQVWRVSASPGRSEVPGVYDLGVDTGAGRDPAAADRAARWLLLRTQD